MLCRIRCDVFNLSCQLCLCTLSNPNCVIGCWAALLFVYNNFFFFNNQNVSVFLLETNVLVFICFSALLPSFPIFLPTDLFICDLVQTPCCCPSALTPRSICPEPACIPKPPLPLPAVARWRNFFDFPDVNQATRLFLSH